MQGFSRPQLIAACVIVALALVGTEMLVAKSGAGHAGSGGITLSEPVSGSPAPAGTPPTPSSRVSPTSPTPGAVVCVHVAGRVKRPGVYNLQTGSRVCDAVKAASGALPDADTESINLAEKLVDGEQVYIAPKGRIPPPPTSTVRGGPTAPAAPPGSPAQTPAPKPHPSTASGHERSAKPGKLTVPGQGTVRINSAGAAELQRLPGIGPSMAQRIIDYRLQKGAFKSVDELNEVKGIGPAKLAKLRPFVSL